LQAAIDVETRVSHETGWRDIQVAWNDTSVRHCEVCGRLLLRREWVFEDGNREWVACSPECQELYATYLRSKLAAASERTSVASRGENSAADPRKRAAIDSPDIVTPALLLDIRQVQANISWMAERFAALPAALRPHAKAHKSPELGMLQIEAGAIGLTTATVWEAEAMVRGGASDVLIANQVVGAERVRRAAELADACRLSVAVDSPENVEELAAAAQIRGVRIDVLIEVDVGMRRCGLGSMQDVVALARCIDAAQGVRLSGVLGYEGHAMLPDAGKRASLAAEAVDHLAHAADTLRAQGFPCGVVSAGGTGTYATTAADPRVTEVQAGSYLFNDAYQQGMGLDLSVALTVLGTVLSRQANRIVVDVGGKSVGVEHAPPYALVADAETLFVHEEHSGYRVPDSCSLRVGDRLRIVPGYAPTTVNLHDAYLVVDDGVVTDRWQIFAQTWRNTEPLAQCGDPLNAGPKRGDAQPSSRSGRSVETE
jgi:D-serine deaminase-like pyridoxal phosphate-dependent protein